MDVGEEYRELTRCILAAAIEVHRHLGPGLLGSSYRACLVQQLQLDGFEVRQEAPITVNYKGIVLPTAYRADLIVNQTALIELKAVDRLLPIHEAQALTYMRHADLHVGLILNFNTPALRHGIRRLVRG
jgi:GxxExxY protein